MKSELTVGAASVASDASGVLTKSEDGEASGVFLAFPEITEETNTTHTALRFSVTNDAANRVGVYAVTSYDAAHPGDAVIGERLGVVTVIGAGTYELDISSYFESLPSVRRPSSFSARKRPSDRRSSPRRTSTRRRVRTSSPTM